MTSNIPLINKPPNPKDKKAYLEWRKKRDYIMLSALKLHKQTAPHTATSGRAEVETGVGIDEDIVSKAGANLQSLKQMTSKGRSRSRNRKKGMFR